MGMAHSLCASCSAEGAIWQHLAALTVLQLPFWLSSPRLPNCAITTKPPPASLASTALLPGSETPAGNSISREIQPKSLTFITPQVLAISLTSALTPLTDIQAPGAETSQSHGQTVTITGNLSCFMGLQLLQPALPGI